MFAMIGLGSAAWRMRQGGRSGHHAPAPETFG